MNANTKKEIEDRNIAKIFDKKKPKILNLGFTDNTNNGIKYGPMLHTLGETRATLTEPMATATVGHPVAIVDEDQSGHNVYTRGTPLEKTNLAVVASARANEIPIAPAKKVGGKSHKRKSRTTKNHKNPKKTKKHRKHKKTNKMRKHKKH